MYDIKQVSERIILIKLLVEDTVLTILSVYAPQTRLEESTKDAFYDCLQTVISKPPDKELFHVVTGMDTLEEKMLDMKVSIEVMGMVNVIQMEIEYLTLLLQMTLSLRILSLTKEIVTVSLINLVMRKPRLPSFF